MPSSTEPGKPPSETREFPSTTWRITEMPQHPGLNVRLVVETTASDVVARIEAAASSAGVKLVREEQVTTKPCPRCRRVDTFTLPAEQVAAYASGAHVQDAFPGLSADQREQLITGYCGPCWNLVMGEDV